MQFLYGIMVYHSLRRLNKPFQNRICIPFEMHMGEYDLHM